MLKLLLGRAGTGKTTLVLQRLVESGKQRQQVLMVPEQQSHEAERALGRAGGDRTTLFADVVSFTRLCSRIFQAAGGMGEQELDAGGRLLLMYQAVREISPQLRVYARPSRRPSFLESLLATTDELKSSCVPPEELISVGESVGGPDGDRLQDLGLICGTFNTMAQQVALDPRDRLTRAAEKLRNCTWAAGKDFWLDGFTDFTPQQMEVLREILRQAHSVTITLTCDSLWDPDPEEGAGIFSPARRTGLQMKHVAQDMGIPFAVEQMKPLATGKHPVLQHLEETLFQPGHPEPTDGSEVLELYQAEGVRSGVEWAAARIRRLVREDGYRYRDIGVVARNYETYRVLVESVFARYDIPVFTSAMTDILEKPVLALVTAALETVANGYRYDDIFRYLKTGLTGISQEDRDLLENYVIRWNIRGSRWTQGRAWNWHPGGYGLKWTDQDHAYVDHLDAIRREVVEPLQLLVRNKTRTGRQHAEGLYDFLENIGLVERLSERVRDLRRRNQQALADEYRQLWEILCGALEQCAQLLRNVPMELDEFAQIFRLVLSQYDVGTIPVALDQVVAGETTRQAGHRVKVLLFMGADDASLPQPGESPGLLTDEDRLLLQTRRNFQLGNTARDLLYREMTTIYLTCALPSERLIVSWPSQGSGGEERRPSFLVERLRHMFPDVKTVLEEELEESFRIEAPLPALEQAGRIPMVRKALELLPEYAESAIRLDDASRWERGRLSREAVDRLYGNEVAMSASRMDKYKSCHFSYFLNYGLKAETRKPAGFAAPEYGTFVHYVLEHVLQDPISRLKSPEEFDDERKEQIHALTQKIIEKYVEEELGGLEEQTERFQYLFWRLVRPVQAVVDNSVLELASSSFEPVSFELGFARDEDLPPVEFQADGVTIRISGFVDRVDSWVKNGRLYLRVADYKTGRKSFDFTDVWNGLGLQMLLYLFTLEDKGQKLYGMPVEGAGVLYIPAREAIIRGSRTMSEEDYQKKVSKELTRSGLILDDPDVMDAMEQPGKDGYAFLPLKINKKGVLSDRKALASAEQFGRLARHVQGVLEEICQEMAAGNISADPFWKGSEKNACLFCDYAAACHFEEKKKGDCRRWLKHLSSDEFWEAINNETEGVQPV